MAAAFNPLTDLTNMKARKRAERQREDRAYTSPVTEPGAPAGIQPGHRAVRNRSARPQQARSCQRARSNARQ